MSLHKSQNNYLGRLKMIKTIEDFNSLNLNVKMVSATDHCKGCIYEKLAASECRCVEFAIRDLGLLPSDLRCGDHFIFIQRKKELPVEMPVTQSGNIIFNDGKSLLCNIGDHGYEIHNSTKIGYRDNREDFVWQKCGMYELRHNDTTCRLLEQSGRLTRKSTFKVYTHSTEKRLWLASPTSDGGIYVEPLAEHKAGEFNWYKLVKKEKKEC